MAEAALTVAGIVFPSLLLTLAVRKWFDRAPWRTCAGFLLLTLIFLGGGIFTPDVPVPVDEAAKGFPYRGVVGEVQSKNALTNDTSRLFLPWMHVVREEFRAGRLPLWNRYSFSGYPLLANGESAPFFPGFLATLFVPLPKQIVALAALKIYASLLFCFLLLRRERLSDGAASFGAIAYAFCSFQTVYLFYSTTAVTSLLPAAAYALVYAVDRPHARRSLWLLALVVATLQAAGHPESVFHVAVGAGLFLLVDLFTAKPSEEPREIRRGLITIAAGTLGGLLISAPAWIPVLQQVLLSSRYAEIAGEGARIMTASFPYPAAWALVAPDLFGNPAAGTWNWILNYSLVASSYVGLLPLSLIPSAIFARPSTARDRALGLLAIATFLLAMNWTLVGAINRLPPFSFVANDKLRFVTCFLAAICAARVAQRMKSRLSAFDLIGPALIGFFAIRAIGTKFGVTLNWRAWMGVVAVALFVVAAFALRRSGRASVLGWIAASGIALELFLLNMPFNALADRRYYKPRLPILEALRSVQPNEPFRVVGQDWTLMPNASALYGLEDVRGSDPMSLAAYTGFFDLIGVEEPGMDVQRVVDLDHSAVDFLNVRYALADPGFVPSSSWLEVYRGADGILLQNAQWLPRFFVPSRVVPREPGPLLAQLQGAAALRDTVIAEGVRAIEDQPAAPINIRQVSPMHFELSLSAGRPLFVASSQPLAPGWTVRIGGKRAAVHAVNGAFVGFVAPQGRNTIEVAYRPRAFSVSLAGSVAGVALLLLFGRRGRRHSPGLIPA